MAASSVTFSFQQKTLVILPVTPSAMLLCLLLELLLPNVVCPLATLTTQAGVSVAAALHQPEALSPSRTQTVATLSVLGTRRVVFILGVENQAVSLAACHLLQVMFDALKEGVRKGFRGKEGAIIVGEWK